MKRIAIFLLVFAAGLTVAQAQVLRPRTLVEDELIRLGDLFTALPAEKAARPIAPAPAPGRTSLFDAAALAQIARENNITWTAQSRFDRVLVQRASRPITAEDIEARIVTALKADGLPQDAQVELLNRRLSLDAATGPGAAFKIQALSYDKDNSAFVATLAVNGGRNGVVPVEVRGRVFRTSRVPVLARPLRHGQIVRAEDIAWKDLREGSIDASLMLDADAIVGKTPRSAVRAGEPLRRTELMAPVIVARGALITMVLSAPQMTLTAQGRAVEDGADGQTIRVVNTRSKTAIEAVVIGPNRVAVRLPSLAANLK